MDSVLAQTYGDFEVIVVDDGSSDHGPDIVNNYRDDRITLIRRENAGPGAARNLGTGVSRGALVTYLDADDEWMPGFLQKSVDILTEHADCDFVASGFYIGPERINRGSQLTGHGIPAGAWRVPPRLRSEQLNYVLGVFHSCSTVYRKWVIEKYGGFYSKNTCKYGEDVYLWLQILFSHKFYRNEEPLAWYHSEASELGLSSMRRSFPIEPSLTDTEPLYRNCPLQYHPLLSQWLGIHALRAAHLNIELADMTKAAQILKALPLGRRCTWEYLRIRIKMLCPGLIPHVRRLKAGLALMVEGNTGRRLSDECDA